MFKYSSRRHTPRGSIHTKVKVAPSSLFLATSLVARERELGVDATVVECLLEEREYLYMS